MLRVQTRLPLRQFRNYSLLSSLKSSNLTIGNGGGGLEKSLPSNHKKISVHPTTPVRTRFAPSPTGFLHLGSLRTALYNYLLAKSTGGQFLLRLEDTDQKRLIPGAEENIYESLKWCNLTYDEGPIIGGPYGPYRQSDRSQIYRKYVDILLQQGSAYKCFCTKERLDKLRDSAKALVPPSTVSYDRYCENLSSKEIEEKTNSHLDYTIRFKMPTSHDSFNDLLHGEISIQPQINYNDPRYEDPILMKSDGLPTYHLANVVDDHLMKITHVIRGEEWLPSTPKHIEIYKAFGWTPPLFVHIPLLTSLSEKKLSKRSGDIGVLSMRDKGILPEALNNFVALFGWSPTREEPGVPMSEIFTLKQMEELFSLDELTKGNAKVDDKKLYYFNKHHLQKLMENSKSFKEIVNKCYDQVKSNKQFDINYTKNVLKNAGNSLSSIPEFESYFYYFYKDLNYDNEESLKFIKKVSKLKSEGNDSKLITSIQILRYFVNEIDFQLKNHDDFNNQLDLYAKEHKKIIKTKDIYEPIRFALTESSPGAKLHVVAEILGIERVKERLKNALGILEKL